MALTATATNNTKAKIYELLELRNPYEVKINQDRSNIPYVVQKMARDLSIAEHFTSICEDIKKRQKSNENDYLLPNDISMFSFV